MNSTIITTPCNESPGVSENFFEEGDGSTCWEDDLLISSPAILGLVFTDAMEADDE